ncbi:ABC transporter substrate-binding lipoprotein [Streptococcus pneumoniae]|nr:ABC transporter substrate-binding lipoprotein [Streptococcus pneumoniae]
MKKIVKYSSLAALALVAAGVLAACSGGLRKKEKQLARKKSSLQPMDHQGHLSMKKMAN